MKGIKDFAAYAVVGTLALGLAACGGTAKEQMSEDYVYINDITGFEPDPVYPNSWLKPDYKDVDKYNTYVVDNVEVVKIGEGVDPEDAERVAAYFRDAVRAKLSEGGYNVVDSVQDDSMVIKLYINGLEQPGGEAANVATSLMIGMSTSVGAVTIEAAFIDGPTGEIQAVVSDSRRGAYMNASPWSNWQDIENAMDDWADEITQSFDDIYKAAGKKMDG